MTKDGETVRSNTLIKKLSKVMAEIERIPKNGTNEFHKYKYVTESDMVDALRGKLAEAGIMIIPSVEKTTTHLGAIQTRNGAQSLIDIEMTFTIYDSESDQQIVAKWSGQGSDSGDKGVYKAMTGAVKYFLMKMFLVSTGDDPEGEKTPHTTANKPTTPKATKEQQEAVVSLVMATGKPRPAQTWLDSLTVTQAEAFAKKLQEEIV